MSAGESCYQSKQLDNPANSQTELGDKMSEFLNSNEHLHQMNKSSKYYRNLPGQ